MALLPQRTDPEKKRKPSAEQQERGRPTPTYQAAKQPLPHRNNQVPSQTVSLADKTVATREKKQN